MICKFSRQLIPINPRENPSVILFSKPDVTDRRDDDEEREAVRQRHMKSGVPLQCVQARQAT